MKEKKRGSIPMNDNGETLINVKSEQGMYDICSIESTIPIQAGELLALACSHPDTQQHLPNLTVSAMGLRHKDGTLYDHCDEVFPGSTVFLCQAKGLRLDDTEYTEIKLKVGTTTRTVSLRVSSRGCRPKLAIEMLCLFQNLDRDEYGFTDPSVKWVSPNKVYDVSHSANRRYM